MPDDPRPKHGRNAYLPWKRVTRPPRSLGLLARITTVRGRQVELALSDDATYPALFLRPCDEPGEVLRVGLQTLVQSVLGSADREAERWTPLGHTGFTPSGDEVWGNDLLTATRRQPPDGEGQVLVLSYHWHDRAPIRDWRIGQRVKNELAGPEWEAIELYPAESRLMDEANEFWLFAFAPGSDVHTVLQQLGSPKRSALTQDELDELSAVDGITGAVQRDDDLTVQR